ncbi:MAG: cytochrome c biogenesis protein ResB [Pseudomonadota bacterium]|nr:cytochrome c biogenesis protein ResB [Pseudomonadota bacterium]
MSRIPLKKFIKFFSSLKLAVVLILSLGAVTSVGTIIEAKYNTMTAQKWVYHSPIMLGLLALLMFILSMVLLDRYPWKRQQSGFVLAHIGLITLLLGSYVTMQWGIDGSLAFPIGEVARKVVIDETEINLWSSFDGDRYTRLYHKDVDFFLKRPSKYPISIATPVGNIKIDDFVPYAFVERKFVGSKDRKKGAGLRFQMQNQFVNVIDWLAQRDDSKGAIAPLGPAQIVLVTGFYKPTGKNEIVLETNGDKESLKYTVYSSKVGVSPKRGVARAGSEIDTGWMGLKFRILNYFPHIDEEVTIRPLKYPTELTRQAIKVSLNDRSQWVELNNVVRFFVENQVYVLEYVNKGLDIGFDMRLTDFTVGRYQGTMRAASYQSEMDVEGQGKVTIAMNEPLTKNGYTFYQASFQEENGKPVLSILSVNRDPGRWIKYLGSLLVVLGIIIMFYFKDYYFPKKESA